MNSIKEIKKKIKEQNNNFFFGFIHGIVTYKYFWKRTYPFLHSKYKT